MATIGHIDMFPNAEPIRPFSTNCQHKKRGHKDDATETNRKGGKDQF